ncbi:MAG: hypothetical protein A2231_01880 [Candidatus Firestonebacteria bacterium RIFOXYA2_FULL_40_8]|nr:MAG: hypothetical protein A2231_01880 [Candidatus Firestonebacteria bacterium RIFOXYA2_FULL_40_8]
MQNLILIFLFLAAPLVAADTGYEGSIPAKKMTPEDKKLISSLPLQDLQDKNKGRYENLKEDGILNIWGLESLKARQDVTGKPYMSLVDSNGIYQTERVVFYDPSTAVMMMKLTNQPINEGGDEISYYGDQAWNANGSTIVWQRSEKCTLWNPGRQIPDEKYGQMLSNGDGSNLRLAFKDQPVMIPTCSPVNPDAAYTFLNRNFMEVNLKTGTVGRTIMENMPNWQLKISPDGKYACGCGWQGKKIVVVSLTENKQWNVELDYTIHDSYRFVPGTESVMFWYEGLFRTDGFVVANFKTGKRQNYNIQFDWNHGAMGRFYGSHTNGDFFPLKNGEWKPSTGNVYWPQKTKSRDDPEPFYDAVNDANGYESLMPDDDLWAFPTKIMSRPYLSEIACIFAKPMNMGGRGNRFRVCLTNLYRGSDRRKRSEGIVLDRPNLSYDGTKILFNSNVFGTCEVYMAVIRKPQVPVEIKAVPESAGIKVTWKKPKYCKEIKGYNVYRSNESGKGFEIITDKPVEGLEYTDTTAKKDGAYFYALKSVEFSRLESELSGEAGTAQAAAAPVRIFVEAEGAIPSDMEANPPDSFWMNIDGTASNLYYIWARNKYKPGNVSIDVDIPKEAEYFIYARVKGKEGTKFSIAKQEILSDAGIEWKWVKSTASAKLKSGKQKISIASAKYGSCLDCFYLSTDSSFEPKGRINAAAPKKLEIKGEINATYPKLTWTASEDKRLYYYNIYCSNQPNFAADRKTLIGSPDTTSFLDWQSLKDKKYYKVTQVTLDGLESEPSNEIVIE